MAEEGQDPSGRGLQEGGPVGGPGGADGRGNRDQEQPSSERRPRGVVSYERDPAARPDSLGDLAPNPAVNLDVPESPNTAQTAARLVVAAVLIGLVAGASVAALSYAVRWAADAFGQVRLLSWGLPVAALASYGVYRALRVPFSASTSDVIDRARMSMPVRLALAPAIFVGTVLTVLCGGSAGKEGAALQLGGAVSSSIGSLVGLRGRRFQEVLVMSGLAAGFSAVLCSPVAAFVFVFEVMHQLSRRVMRVVAPLVSAFVSWAVASALGVTSMVDLSAVAMSFDAMGLAQAALVGLACGLFGIVFCESLSHVRAAVGRLRSPMLGIVLGGAAVALLLGTSDVFLPSAGTGASLMEASLSGGDVAPYTFAAKALLTVLTLSFGVKGGEVMPTFAVGASLGVALSTVLPGGQGPMAAVAMIAFFAAATNCPVSAVVFGVWLFGPQATPFVALASLIAFAVSYRQSVYRSANLAYTPAGLVRGMLHRPSTRKAACSRRR